jgi:hypothetical protein
MATTLDDIAARLDRLESMLLQAGLADIALEPCLMSDVDRIKQKALFLARQGRRAESIELMKSLSGRKGHARL